MTKQKYGMLFMTGKGAGKGHQSVEDLKGWTAEQMREEGLQLTRERGEIEQDRIDVAMKRKHDEQWAKDLSADLFDQAADLAARGYSMAMREKTVKKREAELDKRQSAVEQKEQGIAARELAVNDKLTAAGQHEREAARMRADADEYAGRVKRNAAAYANEKTAAADDYAMTTRRSADADVAAKRAKAKQDEDEAAKKLKAAEKRAKEIIEDAQSRAAEEQRRQIARVQEDIDKMYDSAEADIAKKYDTANAEFQRREDQLDAQMKATKACLDEIRTKAEQMSRALESVPETPPAPPESLEDFAKSFTRKEPVYEYVYGQTRKKLDANGQPVIKDVSCFDAWRKHETAKADFIKGAQEIADRVQGNIDDVQIDLDGLRRR